MYKASKLIFLLTFLLCAIIFSYLLYTNYIKSAPNSINQELKQQINIQNNQNTLLVLFSPDCGPCHILIKSIHENRNSLRRHNIFLASTRDSITTNNFYKDISILWEKDMARFKTIYNARKNISTYFVKSGLPKIYIFDNNHKLLFKSDTTVPIDSILSQLEKNE